MHMGSLLTDRQDGPADGAMSSDLTATAGVPSSPPATSGLSALNKAGKRLVSNRLVRCEVHPAYHGVMM